MGDIMGLQERVNTVLVVSDDPEIMEQAQELLTNAGIVSEAFATAEAAKIRFKTNSVSVCLIDVGVKDVSCEVFALWLQKAQPHTHIIFVSNDLSVTFMAGRPVVQLALEARTLLESVLSRLNHSEIKNDLSQIRSLLKKKSPLTKISEWWAGLGPTVRKMVITGLASLGWVLYSIAEPVVREDWKNIRTVPENTKRIVAIESSQRETNTAVNRLDTLINEQKIILKETQNDIKILLRRSN